MVKYFIISVFFIFLSCVPYYKNEYGIYEPKNPNYSLKDKKDFIFPENLDTINLYKYYGYYDKNLIIKNENKINWSIYNKFCSKGRVYGFGTELLVEKNLNPNFASKKYYYYDKKNKIIKIENFVIADGGQYIILKYRLSKNGDTLTTVSDGKSEDVFIKEKIPKEWKKYKVNW
ncbi:hypothetical protein [Flavobacterium sp.]|uniref:hypothetical protein n=1 Tax=Flavobacterium sp. TaxID=239 RepID=UPI0040485A18